MSPDVDPAGPWLVVSEDTYRWFVDLALDEMEDIVRRLGDERSNRRPETVGSNSPYAVLAHCLGVLEFWGGRMIAERAITRDRDAEFEADGAVEDLLQRVVEGRRRFHEDVSALDALAPPPNVLPPEDLVTPYARTKGAVLLHVMEELFQHLGQMQISRDVLLARG